MEYEALTVGQLLEALAGYPSDMRVLTEGCDCYGKAYDIELLDDHSEHDERVLLIVRPPDKS
jgi:hypothetical protein